MQYEVRFPLQKAQVAVAPGTTLAQASALAGYPLRLGCGQGFCGQCQVWVEEKGGRQKRHACSVMVEENLSVDVPEGLLLRHNSTLAAQAGMLSDGGGEGKNRRPGFTPALRKAFVPAQALQPAVAGSYTRLRDPQLLARLGRSLAQGKLATEPQGITLVLEEAEEQTWLCGREWAGRLLDVQPGDTSATLYGAAWDIGTTNVVLYLYDLTEGSFLQAFAEANRQGAVGADIISRIAYAERAGGTAELQQRLLDTVSRLLEVASDAYPDLHEHLYEMIFCANPLMQHLLFGMYPGALGRQPFASLSREALFCLADDLFANSAAPPGGESPLGLLPQRCRVRFLPLIAGFVGADMTAVLLTLPEDKALRLVVDLGTNGEIALGAAGKYLVASAACGPALEGGNLRWGMAAGTGAITKVTMTEAGLAYEVLGGGAGLGLCGSGVIDLVAGLLACGLMEASGRLLPRLEYLADYPASPLAAHLGEQEGLPAFFLNEQVWLSQRDIRQIQLAKAAIAAGCLALAAAANYDLAEIEEVILAGAFGNHMSAESALAIGLLPPALEGKIRAVGNGAGHGAQLYLLDKERRRAAADLADNAQHWHLAEDPVFAERYIQEMNFPFTDRKRSRNGEGPGGQGVGDQENEDRKDV